MIYGVIYSLHVLIENLALFNKQLQGFIIYLIVDGWGVVGWGRKSYSGPAEIVSFSRWYFSRSNKQAWHILACCIDLIFPRFIFMRHFWHVVSTGYFYVLFLWDIAGSYFRLLEIYENLGLTLSTITYIQYEISFFLIKLYVKVFYIWFKCEAPLFFSNKNHDQQKKHFIIEKYMKKLLNYMLYTHDVTCNMRRWNSGSNDIYKKDQ